MVACNCPVDPALITIDPLPHTARMAGVHNDERDALKSVCGDAVRDMPVRHTLVHV